ncbi:MAG: polyamine aminopropyltransferase [Rhodocyclales bacterium]|jgi:spermidine synthase|nr:MAG: polyamine aminopropyltransferase [Rhodocyclales bacterium]
MQGLHLTADLYRCACLPELMSDAVVLATLCRSRTLNAGLSLVGEKWHSFPGHEGQPGGVTGMLLLAESHVAVHTWPERGGVTLDVYVCNVTSDNSGKAEHLMHALVEAFKPGQAQLERLQRGDLAAPGANEAGELLLEALNPNSVYGFRFARRLDSRRSHYQDIEVLESRDLGRTLRIDGHFMTSEADEFFYHEALTHPVAIAHPAPRRALVIGGGDGGTVEELLKHPSIREVTLVEIDAEVIDVARAYLQEIHRGALDDARVKVRFEDGAAFVAETREKFDLVLLDLTDPETLAGPLYTKNFFAQCKRTLAPGGAMTLHLGSPFHDPGRVRGLAANLNAVFVQVHCYGLHVPLYGAYWGFAVASDTLWPAALPPLEVRQRLDERGISGLRYYNAEIHGALFALPGFYRDLVRH